MPNDIYDDEGELDLDRTAALVAGARELGNETEAKKTLARIQTAALLDIAGSLRTLALESAIAMQPMRWVIGSESAPAEDGDEVKGSPDAGDVKHAPAGTRVRHGDIGAVLGTLTGEGGIDQGEAWVGVHWDDHEGEGYVKVWADDLELVPSNEPLYDFGSGEIPEGVKGYTADELGLKPVTLGDLRESSTPLVGVATEAEAPALLTDADEDGEEATGGYELDAEGEGSPFASPQAEAKYMAIANPTAEHVDDLDADFDGDRHPAAEDALAALKAREAARKRTAKKGSKK